MEKRRALGSFRNELGGGSLQVKELGNGYFQNWFEGRLRVLGGQGYVGEYLVVKRRALGLGAFKMNKGKIYWS